MLLIGYFRHRWLQQWEPEAHRDGGEGRVARQRRDQDRAHDTGGPQRGQGLWRGVSQVCQDQGTRFPDGGCPGKFPLDKVLFIIVLCLIQTEKAREGALTAVGDFDKTKLKKSETDVKNPLPSSEAIAQELEHIKFKVKPSKIHAFMSRL